MLVLVGSSRQRVNSLFACVNTIYTQSLVTIAGIVVDDQCKEISTNFSTVFVCVIFIFLFFFFMSFFLFIFLSCARFSTRFKEMIPFDWNAELTCHTKQYMRSHPRITSNSRFNCDASNWLKSWNKIKWRDLTKIPRLP